MMTITIPGMGNSTPGYYQSWDVPEILGGEVRPFYYEDIMDASFAGRLSKLAAKAVAGYYAPGLKHLAEVPVDVLQDVFLFFLSVKVRDAIEDRLRDLLQDVLKKEEKVRLVGHSLGSLIAYWFLCHHPAFARRVELVTIGSPLGSPVLQRTVRWWMKRVTDAPLHRPGVLVWDNIASVLDPLSGEVSGYGRVDSNVLLSFKEKVFHTEVEEYLLAYRRYCMSDWGVPGIGGSQAG